MRCEISDANTSRAIPESFHISNLLMHVEHPISMEIGIDSFVEIVPSKGASVAELGQQRVRELLAEVELADRVGLDLYGIGEHHRPEYIASSPAVLLAAMAARHGRIRLAGA